MLRSRRSDYDGLSESELAYINRYNRQSSSTYGLTPFGNEPPQFEYYADESDEELLNRRVCVNFALCIEDYQIRVDLHNRCRGLDGFLESPDGYRLPPGMSKLQARNLLINDIICDSKYNPDGRIRPVDREDEPIPEGHHLATVILAGLAGGKPNESFRYHDFHCFRKMSDGHYYYKSAKGEVCSRFANDGGRIVSIKPTKDDRVEFTTEDHVRPKVYLPADARLAVDALIAQLKVGDRVGQYDCDGREFLGPTRFVGYYVVRD